MLRAEIVFVYASASLPSRTPLLIRHSRGRGNLGLFSAELAAYPLSRVTGRANKSAKFSPFDRNDTGFSGKHALNISGLYLVPAIFLGA
jgi:hypothetical protein